MHSPYHQGTGNGKAGGRSPAAQNKQNGISLLELVVVIVIIALLLVVAINRLWVVQEAAEAAAMEQVLGSLRSALGIKLARYLVDDDVAGIRNLAGSNPMDLLSQTPKNYDGEVNVAGTEHMPGGTWYFNRRTGMLIYQVRNLDYFSGGLGTPPGAGFAIRLTYDHLRRHAAVGRNSSQVTGAVLATVAPYHWGHP